MFTLLITCEHASNTVPQTYQRYFRSKAAQQALLTHAGIDLGALRVAQALQRTFGLTVYSGKVSRLLIELNRSAHHPKLWSKFSDALTDVEKRAIVDTYYVPHRNAVMAHIAKVASADRPVLHVGVHSFTPTLNGEVRTADVGLLYDPRRKAEQAVCKRWQQELEAAQADIRVRRNYPYRGNSDGFTTSLRRHFAPEHYLGIELEINQAHLVGVTATPQRMARLVCQTLRRVLTG